MVLPSGLFRDGVPPPHAPALRAPLPLRAPHAALAANPAPQVASDAPHMVGGSGDGSIHGCKGRTLMLTPRGKVSSTAGADGTATITVPQVDRFDACHTTVFEVVEAVSERARAAAAAE
eukprot:4974518-Prymnesium_polylepis.1